MRELPTDDTLEQRFATFVEAIRPVVFNDLFQKLSPGAAALVGRPVEEFSREVYWDVYRFELQSPLEGIFLLYWRALEALGETAGLTLVPQFDLPLEARTIRPDFVIFPDVKLQARRGNEALRRGLMLAVELDGHDFHERTKQQVAERNQRDRVLQQTGFMVCHFSGSELVRAPDECVRDVVRSARQRGLQDFADAGEPATDGSTTSG